jgi:hypothetical protein
MKKGLVNLSLKWGGALKDFLKEIVVKSVDWAQFR